MLRSVLVPLPPPEWGGLQVFAANINAPLREAGWRWITVVPNEATLVQERLLAAGVDVIAAALPRLRRSPWKTLRSIAAMSSHLRQLSVLDAIQKVDVVQAVGAHHPHGALLASRLRRPLVWQLHSSIMPWLGRRIVAPIISAHADIIMTNGRQVAADFWGREDLGKNHFVFYAPVDVDRFKPDPQARNAARIALGYSDDVVVIGTVGNRVWQKNHGLLVEVAGRLASRYPKLRFCILGTPSDGYRKAYAETVEAPAAALNVRHPGYIQFVAPEQRVDYWLHALDIFTFTSHAEGVPIALFEAMAAAKPVVSVDVGSIREIVLEGRTGFLCPRGSADALADAYVKLVDKADLRERFAAASLERVRRDFSLDRVVAAHVDAYQAAINTFQR